MLHGCAFFGSMFALKLIWMREMEVQFDVPPLDGSRVLVFSVLLLSSRWKILHVNNGLGKAIDPHLNSGLM